MRLGVAFGVCLVALLGTNVSAQIVVGAGSQSCGQWLQAHSGDRTEDAVRRSMIVSWVQGFLVGHASGVSNVKMAPEIARRIGSGELPPNILDSDPQRKLLTMYQAKFGTLSGWVFDPPDLHAIEAWLDKYCREHPLDNVRGGSDKLAAELDQSAR
jgi:hypothetical protein